jgi:hypothetical protein
MRNKTGEVIRLFHDGWPKLKTLGQLVDVGKATPKTDIIAKVIHHFHEIERLKQAGKTGPAMLRQLIVTGVAPHPRRF